MTTDKDIADDFEKWRAYYEKDGYQVHEVTSEYEGRDLTMQVIWPESGSDEEDQMIEAIADFIWNVQDGKNPK